MSFSLQHANDSNKNFTINDLRVLIANYTWEVQGQTEMCGWEKRKHWNKHRCMYISGLLYAYF